MREQPLLRNRGQISSLRLPARQQQQQRQQHAHCTVTLTLAQRFPLKKLPPRLFSSEWKEAPGSVTAMFSCRAAWQRCGPLARRAAFRSPRDGESPSSRASGTPIHRSVLDRRCFTAIVHRVPESAHTCTIPDINCGWLSRSFHRNSLSMRLLDVDFYYIFNLESLTGLFR